MGTATASALPLFTGGVHAVRNMLENGSFEQHGILNHGRWGITDTLPGWVVDGDGIELQQRATGGLRAQDGLIKLELDAVSNGTLYQETATTPGLRYGFSLYYSPRVKVPGTDTNDVEVMLGDEMVALLGGDHRAWQYRYFDFLADSELTTLTLSAAGSSDSRGGLIDDIRFVPTPYLSSNLITNGSFEGHGPLDHGGWGTFQTIEGWVSRTGWIEIQHYATAGLFAQEGKAKLELDSIENSEIYQNVSLTPGAQYELSLYYSPRGGSGSDSDSSNLSLFWNGELLDQLTGWRAGWQYHHYDIVASGKLNELSLAAAGTSDGVGALVDNIRLYKVPFAGTDLIVNGSFEQQGPLDHGNWGTVDSLDGWVVEQGEAEIQRDGTAGIGADEGAFKLELDSYGNSSIYQDIPTVAGRSYRLMLAYAPRVRSEGTDTNDVEVWWDDQLVTTLSGDARHWTEYRFDLLANRDPSRLTLVAAGASDSLGGLIDDVRLYPLDTGNRSPVIETTPVTQAFAGQEYRYTVGASDPDGQTLVYGLVYGPDGMTIDENGQISWLPEATGLYSVSVKVSDLRGGDAVQQYALSVEQLNHAPVLTSSPVLVAEVGYQYDYHVSATDEDGDHLRYRLKTAPQGMTVDEQSGLIQWLPAAAGAYPVEVSVLDDREGTDSQLFTVQVAAPYGNLPAAPETIAPLPDPAESPAFHEMVAYLYQGEYPIQRGVQPDSLEVGRAAVVRGQVLDTDGRALPGVVVRIHRHPEYGTTLSRLGGGYDMAVNGGGRLTVDYRKAGYLPVQRQIEVPWNDFAVVQDVVMTPLGSRVDRIDLSDTSRAFQVAQSNAVTDIDGTRRATLLFPQGTVATMTLPNGGTQALTTLNVRATEYTVGETGPRAMPGELPPSSGYTYAVELSVDEAIAAGATRVDFDRPLPLYVDNFLNFPVGEPVPVGWYDREKAAWIPADNGRVIGILSISDGLAELDVEGSGTAADSGVLAGLGITDAERAQLAVLYAPGKSLWRVRVTHFTPWDCNWPYGPPMDAVPPPSGPPPEGPPETPPPDEEEAACDGCIIQPQSQSLGERLPVIGTELNLRYQSERMPGYKRDMLIPPHAGL
jgi:hypothetical protein